MAIHEECGVFGIFGTKRENVANIAYYGYMHYSIGGRKAVGLL